MIGILSAGLRKNVIGIRDAGPKQSDGQNARCRLGKSRDRNPGYRLERKSRGTCVMREDGK